MSNSLENNKLSIAIPVYNFGDFLPETLESILQQPLGKKIEIVVYDGGSVDNTREVMKSFIKNFSNIRYVKALTRGGIDVDMAKCIDLVSSEYCWLFSGDDVMHIDAISRILNVLKANYVDLLLVRHFECNFELNRIVDWPVLGINQDRLFQMHNKAMRNEYLDLALSSEAFFSFMGGLIVKRSTWFKGDLPANVIGSNWGHVQRLWSLVDSPFEIYYLNDPVLDRRGGNDSFSKDGALSRLEIQIHGLLSIFKNTFGETSNEVKNLKRVLNWEVFPNWALAVKNELDNVGANLSEYARLEELLKEIA